MEDPQTESLERTGTELTGFVSSGPQVCGRCIHNQNSICMHPVVALDPDLEDRRTNGGVQIDPATDCCEFVNVSGDTGPEQEEESNESDDVPSMIRNAYSKMDEGDGYV